MMASPSSPNDRDVVRCYEEGARRFPEIRWDVEGFAAACVVDGAGQAGPAVDDFVRLACLANRPGAAEILEREYLKPLRGRLFRVCQGPDLTDSVLQQLLEELLLPPERKLAAYRNPGSLRVWLAVVASRMALDALRRAGAQARREVELHDQLEVLATGPEQYFQNEELRHVFRTALRAAVKSLPARDRQVLRLHVVSQWNITQIGRVFSVHRATVARWLVTAKEQLRVSLRDQLAPQMGTAAPEEQQLLQGLPSCLDVSLSHVFATTGVSRAALG